MLPPNVTTQILLAPEILLVFMIVRKFFHKFRFRKIFLAFEIPNLIVGCSRKLSKVANLASKYDCANPPSLREMMFFDFFKFSQPRLKKFRKIEIPIHTVGCCLCILKGCKICSQIGLLKFFIFREMDFSKLSKKMFRKLKS